MTFSKHILYVQSTVPKEDLLIWQVKDGWKPICDFLRKPIPEGPIPHDNRTGDVKFMDDFSVNIKVTQDGLRKLRNRFGTKFMTATVMLVTSLCQTLVTSLGCPMLR